MMLEGGGQGCEWVGRKWCQWWETCQGGRASRMQQRASARMSKMFGATFAAKVEADCKVAYFEQMATVQVKGEDNVNLGKPGTMPSLLDERNCIFDGCITER